MNKTEISTKKYKMKTKTKQQYWEIELSNQNKKFTKGIQA